MKKILPVLVSGGLLLAPLAVLAQVAAPQNCTLSMARNLAVITGDAACAPGALVSVEDHGMCCLLNTIYNITDWIFIIMAVIVGLLIIIGAFMILTAGGAPEKVASGRNFILYAVIGLVIAFFAKGVPTAVRLMVGVS